ncbi:MAG: DUF4440 domain-containing protein [Sulfitobacter sp.]
MDQQTYRTLRVLEESLWRPETRFDDKRMESVFADDFFEFGRSGRVYSRSEMMLGSQDYDQIDAVLPLPGFEARYLAEDLAQVTYVSEVRYGTEIERANRSSIWCRQHGQWRLRFHQGTAILNP